MSRPNWEDGDSEDEVCWYRCGHIYLDSNTSPSMLSTVLQQGRGGAVAEQYHFHMPEAKLTHGDLPYVLSGYVDY